MGRRKVRNYQTREYYEDKLNLWFAENTEKILPIVARELGFGSVESMQNEYRTGCWFDCGWVKIIPRNSAQAREWRLDNPYGSSEMFVDNPCYPTQSTNILKVMVEQALYDLGLMDEFSIIVRLD